jgi:fatty acid desaturase
LFNTKYRANSHFYIRQFLGSCNANTGGFFRDYLHGYLNYQIEHHLEAKLSLLQYTKIQPEIEKLCQEYDVPYIQESVFVRLKKTIKVFLGKDTMEHTKSDQYIVD